MTAADNCNSNCFCPTTRPNCRAGDGKCYGPVILPLKAISSVAFLDPPQPGVVSASIQMAEEASNGDSSEWGRLLPLLPMHCADWGLIAALLPPVTLQL